MEQNDKKKVNVAFAAINQYVETNIVSPVERKVRGKDMVMWGDGNIYPQYLLELYRNVTSLHSIIDGDVDYIAGDDVNIGVTLPGGGNLPNVMNRKGETIREQVKDVAFELDLFGGFALEVIRGRDGSIAEVNYISLEHLRSNPDNDVFYYCEDWRKFGVKDTIVYPKFSHLVTEHWAQLTPEERERNIASILFIKNTHNQTYPAPKYAAAVKACETERCTDVFHLNAVNNNFNPSVIINFNNGTPSDEDKNEIEDNIDEKFCGSENAARPMLSFNEDKDHEVTVTTVKTEDFGERYKALSEHCRQQILSAFRVSPNLVGLPTATGFSTEEYEAAFKLYNRTQIRPAQRTIVEAYEKLFRQPGVLVIKPFSLDGDAENNVL